ncbi:hypothetical protein C8Q76DRAFT_705979 [Earliella scabrosa]|nr:hypothetical protein C8Q76DRAFT_705979 [Earliella scabrosa]
MSTSSSGEVEATRSREHNETTTTATYELLKYSRAYGQSNNPASSQAELEWQHFANPVIRLMLDTKKSPEGRLDSYRLRIVWTFSNGVNSMDVDERELVFEDLDLVLYSTMQSFQAPQGMPIKAVYQGAIVGLRYQHPRVAPPGQVPQYRRFQVAFQSEPSATAFIDSIRFICPCKPNPAPSARPPRPVPMQTQDIQSSRLANTTHIAASPSRVPPPGNLPASSTGAVHEPRPRLPSSSSTNVRRATTALTGYPSWDTPASVSHVGGHESRPPLNRAQPTHHDQDQSSRPSSAVTASSAVAHHSSSEMSAPSSDPASQAEQGRQPYGANISRPSSQRGRKEMFAHGGSSDIDSTLPSSSVPPSSPTPLTRVLPRSPELMPPPPVPPQASFPRSSQATQTPTSSAPGRPSESDTTLVEKVSDNHPCTSPSSTLRTDIVESLKDDGGLYKLPKADLEKLVASVIREEGFSELVSDCSPCPP